MAAGLIILYFAVSVASALLTGRFIKVGREGS